MRLKILSHVQQADEALVRLGRTIVETCGESQMPCNVIASEALRSELTSDENCQFAGSFEEALP